LTTEGHPTFSSFLFGVRRLGAAFVLSTPATNRHPDRSGPIFFFAPISGASGRVARLVRFARVEGSLFCLPLLPSPSAFPFCLPLLPSSSAGCPTRRVCVWVLGSSSPRIPAYSAPGVYPDPVGEAVRSYLCFFFRGSELQL